MNRKQLNFSNEHEKKITFKPADKNLGVVLLNTDDYVMQCITHLSNRNIYQQAECFPAHKLTNIIENTLINFKNTLYKTLYKYLLPTNNHQIPQFYGLPKLHKEFTQIPQIRPIVSHMNSLLSPTAKFIDHILQPLAQLYTDYLHNSTTLITTLETMIIPHNTILVTVDVKSLYPSIPQTECLNIIYKEMNSHQDLILFDPDLIIQLLQINVENNYFEFGGFFFKQIKGTAMGATFSLTVANIFMSVILHKFLQTQTHKPFFLKRYIDDIFIIWPAKHDLQHFMNKMNSYHPCLQFTFTTSNTSVDFLDVTIYKSQNFHLTNTLEVKTFQKQHNLYQYLHYSSHHPTPTYKGLIKGECIRYIRTNTSKANYLNQTRLLHKRLLKRGYPQKFISKQIEAINYDQRQHYLAPKQRNTKTIKRPIFKCLPPSGFSNLRKIILQDFHTIRKYIHPPLFINLGHKTLAKHLIRAKLTPTNEQLIDIITTLPEYTSNTAHNNTNQILSTQTQTRKIQKCSHPKCATCQHINTNNHFKSTSTKTTYPIRHTFTCGYVITCTKCKKQYIGMTTRPLRERINHHRTSIRNNQNRYISIHFNFPDHSIDNLSVQPIDKAPTTKELLDLEQFWLHKLKTYRPYGLNNTM